MNENEDFENELDISYFDNEFSAEIGETNMENSKWKYETRLEYEGGYKGGGEEMWIVSKLINKEKNKSIFIEFSGYYNSWDASHFDKMYLVEPKEVTVIKYKKIKE
jgi:hypothetical protein